MCMKHNKRVVGIGLGFNLLLYYAQTGLPYDLIMEEEEQSVHVEGKYRKAVIEGKTGDYYMLGHT